MRVVQIGANTGNDKLSKYLKQNYKELEFGLFVDANPLVIDDLQKTYKQYSNVIIENIGIKLVNHFEDTLKFYYHTKDIFDGTLYGITSCKLEHIQKHIMICPHLEGGEIKEFEIPCITLENLFKKYNITELDWLLLDVEGIDDELLLTTDWSKYNIKRIEFEHLHLGDNKNKIKEMLENLGYVKTNSLDKFDDAWVKKTEINEMNITSNWQDIEGWFDYSFFYKICFEAVPNNSIMVEIGSWMGRSTSCMGELIKNSNKNVKFFAVDTFEGDRFDEQKNIVKTLKEQNSSLFEVFENNLKKCGVNEYVIPIQSTSLEAAEQFEDNSLDFVHIDASHIYEDVIEDIRAWYPKVKPGGLITGDDYPWPGVKKAVHQFFDSKSVVIVNSDNNYPGQVWGYKKEGGISQMNITLYAICKNEEKNVEKFIENSKKFSHTVVVDTGSTDNTVSLLRDAGIEVYEHSQTKEEFDFSLARNQALSYVKTDWAFSLDFNEDVNDFFPDSLDFVQNDITCFKHLRFNDDGNEEPQQSFEVHTRFHRTENYRWENAVHEFPCFIPSEKFSEEVSVDTTIKITKKIKSSISKELFYLSLCEREYQKDTQNYFYVWFIFNHYSKIKNAPKTLEYGQEYLNISKAYFDSYRIRVFIECSQLFLSSNNIQQAANYAFHAVSEAMNLGEPYMSQAFSYLAELSKKLNNPNITVFATAFNDQTLRSSERHQAIDKLFLTNLDDIPATAWTGHRQFAEWLVSYIKPEVIVDLGTNWGFSAFSFAMPRIGKVYTIDNFIGDDFVGTEHGKSMFDYVISKREKLFLDDNVEIINGDFTEVSKNWDKRIDILHIDGSHHYEDVKNDYETWSKFVNDGGVILFHDTCVEDANVEYGVKKFFEEIDLPKCTFTHCFGLGVVSKNKQLIEIVKRTFNLE